MREEDTVCVGSDGLQYCKVCGEAKEAFFPKGDFMGMKKHSRQCACDRKAYEEEQKYFKEKEHRELVSRNTSICFDESRMEEWTFENTIHGKYTIDENKCQHCKHCIAKFYNGCIMCDVLSSKKGSQ